MVNIIKSDFYRIIKGRLGFISALLIFLFGILLVVIARDYTVKELIESTLSSGAIFMPIMITNILVISWGHEFNYRTVNNALISGISRMKYFISKVLLTFLLMTLFLIMYSMGLTLATLVFKGSVDLGYTLKILSAQFPMYLAVSSLGVLLFNVVNATYVSIMIFIVMAFIGDNIISMIIETYFKKLDFLMDYLFISNISNVTNISVLTNTTMLTYSTSAVALTVIFIMISYQTFKQKEFK